MESKTLRGEAHIKEASPLLGFEAPPAARKRGYLGLHGTKPGATALLRLESDSGLIMEPIMITSWGALALRPYFQDMGFDDQPRWIALLVGVSIIRHSQPAPWCRNVHARRAEILLVRRVHDIRDRWSDHVDLPILILGFFIAQSAVRRQQPLVARKGDRELGDYQRKWIWRRSSPSGLLAGLW